MRYALCLLSEKRLLPSQKNPSVRPHSTCTGFPSSSCVYQRHLVSFAAKVEYARMLFLTTFLANARFAAGDRLMPANLVP